MGYTSKQFVDFLKAALAEKYVYWYGTYGNRCTQSKYTSKSKQYPSHYTAARASTYKQHIAEGRWCVDCVGLMKHFFWSGGKLKTEAKYNGGGVPDKSADGMFEWAKKQGAQWGVIGTIPDEAGLAVRYSGHVGYTIGGGYVIEARGFAYGVVKTKLAGRKWSHWYRIPGIDYGAKDTADETPISAEGSGGSGDARDARVLRRDCAGEDVRTLQVLLIQLGYSCGDDGADGDFGPMTEAAVKRFQAAHGLEADGEAGPLTLAALAASMVGEGQRSVRITGDLVNVRSAPGLAGRVLGLVRKGDTLTWQGERQADERGVEWLLVIHNGQNGWVSTKWAEVL